MDWVKSWHGGDVPEPLPHGTSEGVGECPSVPDTTDLADSSDAPKAVSVRSLSLKSGTSSIHRPPSFLEEEPGEGTKILVVVESADGDGKDAKPSLVQKPRELVEAVFEEIRPVPDAIAEPPQSQIGASAFQSRPITTTIQTSPNEERSSLPQAGELVASQQETLVRKDLAPPRKVKTLDALIDCGIGEYTFLPGNQGVLGRGKFSSVWLARRGNGLDSTGKPQVVAIKHTPLYPHPQVIAQRLLREPNLLATLQSSLKSPHPNLVKIYELIRTPGHFYLVEEYLEESINLEDFVQKQPSRQLDPVRVAKIMDQLVSALRDACHPLPARIAHRDIKPENILINPTTLHVTLLDFGLATHFSASAAKLTTVCGSPAYHSPELVLSLSRPSGEICYWGPEVDAWCLGVTMLRVLCGRIYPIGEQNRSISGMLERARLSSLLVRDKTIRERVNRLLVRDGLLRMRNLEEDRAPRWTSTKSLSPAESPVDMPSPVSKVLAKSTTFIPQEPTEGLEITMAATGSRVDAISTDPAPNLVLLNTAYHSAAKIMSWLKYCLRCAGIIYHVRTAETSSPVQDMEVSQEGKVASDVLLQCAWTVPDDVPVVSKEADSRPPLQRSKSQPVNKSGYVEDGPKKIRAIKFWIVIRFNSDTFSIGSSDLASRKSPSPNQAREVLSAEELTGRLTDLGLKTLVSIRHDSLGQRIPTRTTVEASDPRPWSTIVEAIRAGTSKRRLLPSSRRPAGGSATTDPTAPVTPGRFARKVRTRPTNAASNVDQIGMGLGLAEITEVSPGPLIAVATLAQDQRRKGHRRRRSKSREGQTGRSLDLPEPGPGIVTGASSEQSHGDNSDGPVLLPKLTIDPTSIDRTFVLMTPKSAKRHSLHRAATTGTPTIALDFGVHPSEMYMPTASPSFHGHGRKGSIAGSLDNWSKDSSYGSSDEGSHIYQRKDSVTSLQDLAERYSQKTLSNQEGRAPDATLRPGPRVWERAYSGLTFGVGGHS